MTMKLLFENWRGFLNEGMRTPDDLPDGVGILIDTEESPDEIRISYVDLHNAGTSNKPRGEVVIGNMPSQNAEWFGTCLNAWVVQGAHADHGWGPLLYDVAIEWASMRGSGVGLAPDRSMVSAEAEAVWDNYMNSRSDVEMMQLDNMKNELTPEESDNCAQNAAVSNAASNSQGVEWHQSSLSKVYKKKGAGTIKALQAAQKLVFREEGDL